MLRGIRLQPDYVLARCCRPVLDDRIVGYYSHDRRLRVHRYDCPNLRKAEQSRLVRLEWDNILQKEDFSPDKDYSELDRIDFAVLKHHRAYGIDYSLMVARMLEIGKQVAFDCHKKLRAMRLLKRVDAVMVQYRKGVADHEWIKHRNHTYYELTARGKKYIDYYLSHP